jgi:hypothetical protein
MRHDDDRHFKILEPKASQSFVLLGCAWASWASWRAISSQILQISRRSHRINPEIAGIDVAHTKPYCTPSSTESSHFHFISLESNFQTSKSDPLLAGIGSIRSRRTEVKREFHIIIRRPFFSISRLWLHMCHMSRVGCWLALRGRFGALFPGEFVARCWLPILND